MTKVHLQTFKEPRSLERIAVIRAILEVEPIAAFELGRRMKCNKKTARAYLNHLLPHLYVAGWDKSQPGRPAQMYRWGNLPDVPLDPLRPTRGKRANEDGSAFDRAPRWAHHLGPDRLEEIRSRNHFKPQPARRDQSVMVMFGSGAA